MDKKEMDYPKTMTQFCRTIGDLGLELPDETPRCDYESIRKVNPIAINLGLWHSRLCAAPESQRKQMIIALRLAEILGLSL